MKVKVEEKIWVPKLFFDGKKEFIRHVQKTCVMDIKRLQVNESRYIEGTICLVNTKGMVFREWAHAHKWVP